MEEIINGITFIHAEDYEPTEEQVAWIEELATAEYLYPEDTLPVVVEKAINGIEFIYASGNEPTEEQLEWIELLAMEEYMNAEESEEKEE